jgi:hypothetical protein
MPETGAIASTCWRSPPVGRNFFSIVRRRTCYALPQHGMTMSTLLRNAAAVLAGIVIGGLVNMMLISLSPSLIPPPAGVDVSDPDSLIQSIHLFEPRHFVMPFLAHALGTLAGAFAAYMIAITARFQIAMGIGVAFLVGGLAATFMIPAPAWFIALDLLGAYIPMAWLGARLGALATRSTGRPATPA